MNQVEIDAIAVAVKKLKLAKDPITEKFSLAFINGIEWEKYLETFGVTRGDQPHFVCIDPNDEKNFFTRKPEGDFTAGFLQFLKDLEAGSI